MMREPVARGTDPGALKDWSVDGHRFDGTFERGRLCIEGVARGILRVRFTPTDFTPRRSWDVTVEAERMRTIPLECTDNGSLTLKAGHVTVTVNKQDGRLSFRHDSGYTFAEDITQPDVREAELARTRMRVRQGDTLPEGRASIEVSLQKRMYEDEHYYGFGQRAGGLERQRRTFSQWTIDPEFGHGRHQDNLYQAHPAFMALRPGFAWGMFLHATWYSQLDVGATGKDVLELTAHGGELDYYLFTGSTPKDVVEGLTRLTGRPLMPPLWALGYHQSRWGYKSDREMLGIAKGFREREIPIDVIHFDIDYMHDYRDFTFHPERFPDPAGTVDALNDMGIRVVSIIDPGVKHDLGANYRVADEGVAQNMFITDKGGTPFTGYCWPDEALFPDFASARVRHWWGEQHKGYMETGISGIWNDMNEPAIFSRPFSEGLSVQHPMPLGMQQGEGDERTVHAEVHNLYGHLMARATYEGLKRLRPNERPWVLTRSAFVGTQKYAAVWMGDNHSWWEHLQMSLPQLMSVGLCGAPFGGVDIGGFFENSNAELYARWVQMGTFYPFMRTHTAAGTAAQEPWSFGHEVEEIARDAIRLRYRLLPYLYTLAHHAHRTGDLWFRPLFYDYPNDPATYHLDDQVLVGSQLLVAPVMRPGQETRMVYLPEGDWYDYWTGQRLQSGYHLTDAPLHRIPLFVRGGGILPLGNVRHSTMEPLTELTLELYPSRDSHYTLYEDDGISWGFQSGACAETTIHLSEKPDGISVKLEPRKGDYKPHPRNLVLRVHTRKRPKRLELDGKEGKLEWDETTRAASIRLKDDGQGHELKVVL